MVADRSRATVKEVALFQDKLHGTPPCPCGVPTSTRPRQFFEFVLENRPGEARRDSLMRTPIFQFFTWTTAFKARVRLV
jgi:hypothetical protein